MGKTENEFTLIDDTFFINTEFNETLFKDVALWILKQNRLKNFKELNLIINSPGGSLSSCFGIVEMMNGSCLPINTIGIGQIASCGFLTFISGKKRILTPNTLCLSHDYGLNGFLDAKYHELVASRKIEDFMAERIRNIYKKTCSKELSDLQLEEKLLGTTDRWLYPQEVKDLGFCDEIKYLN